jgi:tungstate transport system permease protein
VDFIWNGVKGAFDLLLHPTPDFLSIVKVSLQVSLWATLLALCIGVPIGLSIALATNRRRGYMLAVANSGFGLPPVVVGLFVALLLFRRGPLGDLDLIYTVKGMILAQVILDLPVVIALTASAAMAVDAGLVAQAKALGASRWRVLGFLGREARAGIAVAAIASVGAGLSEVGAVVLVGGNIDGQTRTMAGAILTTISAGRYDQGIALGILLLGMVVFLAALLTYVQARSPANRHVDAESAIP